MTSSLGLINLLEWLIELRETFHSLNYQFITKGHNNQMEEMHKAKTTPSELATLPYSPCIHQPRSSPNPTLEVLWGLHYKGLLD